MSRRNEKKKSGLLPWVVIAALIALAILYLRCKGGLGLGGGAGTGTADEPRPVAANLPDAGVPRCTLRLTAEGLTVDGRAASADQAITSCKRGGADVIVTGDARQGDWDSLRAALDAAGVEWFERGSTTARDGGL